MRDGINQVERTDLEVLMPGLPKITCFTQKKEAEMKDNIKEIERISRWTAAGVSGDSGGSCTSEK